MAMKFKAPLSGDVTQMFRFLTSSFSSVGSQFGFINIYAARSSAPEVEEEVLEEVGSYGRQLGRIGDAMAVLLRHMPKDAVLTADEEKAIRAFRSMLDDINDIKEKHDRNVLRA